jgi:hypothetical protein
MIFRHAYIYLLNTNQDNDFFPSKACNPSPLLVYIIYAVPMADARKLKCWLVFVLKPISEALLSMHINVKGGNWFCLNHMQFGAVL